MQPLLLFDENLLSNSIGEASRGDGEAKQTVTPLKEFMGLNIPTTIHNAPASMQQVSVSDERDTPDGSSSVSMRRDQ